MQKRQKTEKMKMVKGGLVGFFFGWDWGGCFAVDCAFG